MSDYDKLNILEGIFKFSKFEGDCTMVLNFRGNEHVTFENSEGLDSWGARDNISISLFLCFSVPQKRFETKICLIT